MCSLLTSIFNLTFCFRRYFTEFKDEHNIAELSRVWPDNRFASSKLTSMLCCLYSEHTSFRKSLKIKGRWIVAKYHTTYMQVIELDSIQVRRQPVKFSHDQVIARTVKISQ